MESKCVNLSNYRPKDFERGAGRLKEALWLVAKMALFELCPMSLSAIKCSVLRLFGAKIGCHVVIKPHVKITFPWKLEIGNYVWLGEECWLLNLDRIVIGDHVCVSQRAFLCTGSHNYKSATFDLITKPIRVEEGAWVGAGAWIGPGVTVGTHAVLSAGSVTGKNLDPWGIYQGNPALFARKRSFES